MKPVDEISLPAWMKTPRILRVMDLLSGTGEVPKTLFVGGCVRDAFLGKDVRDIDLATIYNPEMVMARLEEGGVKVILTGLDHGTVTAVLDGGSFEITTLRKDVSTDGRRAVVAFTDDWVEDAKRRDFTMNTLLADIEGRIYDPLGSGLEDLKAGVVRFVGEADQRIREDYLRVLRLFRFQAFYGREPLEAEELKACARHAAPVLSLSRERITVEFLKLLAADNPVPVLGLMHSHGVLQSFFAEGYKPEDLETLCMAQKAYGFENALVRLSVILGHDVAHFEHALTYLSLSKREQAYIRSLCALLPVPDFPNDERALCVLAYEYGQDEVLQAFLCVHGQKYPAVVEMLQKWERPRFPLSGNDLMAKGVQPGPALGGDLSTVERWWVEQDFKPGREACLSYWEQMRG